MITMQSIFIVKIDDVENYLYQFIVPEFLVFFIYYDLYLLNVHKPNKFLYKLAFEFIYPADIWNFKVSIIVIYGLLKVIDVFYMRIQSAVRNFLNGFFQNK